MAMLSKTGSILSLVDTSEWDTLLDAFLVNCEGQQMKDRTLQYYQERCGLFLRWIREQQISMTDFRGRHMSAYIAYRRTCPGKGKVGTVSFATLTHDGKSVRRLIRFAVAEEMLEKDPLSDYRVRKAPDGNVYCPSLEEVYKLLQTVKDRWDPAKNEKAGYVPPAERKFYAALHTAIIGGLVATGARINELLALTLENYQPDRLQIYIPASKNGDARYVPYKAGWLDMVASWRKVRPKAAKTNLLFINRFGGEMNTHQFGLVFRRYRELAGLPNVTVHSLRHYAISQLAKVDVLMAANAAGHRSLEVTRKYVHKDADHIRTKYDEADPLGKVLINKRSQQQAAQKARKSLLK